ncbi:HDOD domain-containing protein [Stratiformator vulcanicus]|uniref:HDOD domain protein n=1 Tax=Stratiformator vulcanicus TaxID=2527980 RepID=A0A517QX52_9PLAN|nr:HDOD domain-containing protein [Stratiformator vulcanicus]QDT36150.1 HDOD domain protein [Stratiformator vulcanicus]
MIDWNSRLDSVLGATSESKIPPNVKLPVLPHAAIEFAQRSKSEDVTAKELGSIIESDGGLTCELLKQVNGAASGLTRKIATAAQAIALLGLKTTKLFVLSAAVDKAMKTRESRLIHLKTFWTANLERALFAREFAKLLKADPDVAFAGGMLQDFLLPTLANEMTDHYVDLLAAQSKASERRLDERERQSLKWDHAVAAGQLLRQWDFPEELVACVAYHHHGLRLMADKEIGRSPAAAVAVSSLLPDAIRQSPNGLNQLIQLDRAWPAFDLEAIAGVIEDELQKMNAPRDTYVTLARRLESAMATA